MTPDAIKANFDARQAAVNELRSLDASAAGREFSAEERQKEERLNAAISEFDARIQEGLRSLAAEKENEARAEEFARLTAKPAPTAEVRSADEDVLGKLIRGEVRSADFAPSRDEVRALNKTDDATLVPDTLYKRLHETVRELSTIMVAGSDVWRTSSGERITMPKVSAYSAASIVGEGQTIGQSEPSFASHFTIDAYKYAFMVLVSKELLDDDQFDLVSFLGRQGGEAMSNGIGTHLLSGTGTGQPNGALNNTLTKVLASASAITGDELIDTQHAVKQAFRNRAVWAFNDATLAVVRKLKDSNGAYLWQPGLQIGQPDTLLGRPVLTDPAIPELDGTVDASVGIFGDLKGYVTRFSGALRVERSDEFKFDTDQVAFRFIQRADGEIMDSNSFVVVTAAAA